MTSRVTGTEATSAARTAKPSMAVFANGEPVRPQPHRRRARDRRHRRAARVPTKTGDTIEDVLTGFVEGDHPVRLEAVRLQSSTHMAATSAPSSPRSESSTLARSQSAFCPASKPASSTTRPRIPRSSICIAMASVSWISPPSPAQCAGFSKMSGVRTYRPVIRRFDGASSKAGFSTSRSTVMTSPWRSLKPAQP